MLKTFITSILLLLVTLPVSAALNVFACEPEWAAHYMTFAATQSG